MCSQSLDPTISVVGSSQRVKHWGWFLGLAVAGCALDLITKTAVFRWLGPPTGVQNISWLVEGYIGIETALNQGALFGMGQGKVWLFAVMSFVALAGIVFWLVKMRAIEDGLLSLTLGLVTGGVLGNLYDRLGIWSEFKVYAVRDWIRFSYDYNAYVWPNFNIADSLLVCGAALLVWHSYRNPHTQDQD